MRTIRAQTKLIPTKTTGFTTLSQSTLKEEAIYRKISKWNIRWLNNCMTTSRNNTNIKATQDSNTRMEMSNININRKESIMSIMTPKFWLIYKGWTNEWFKFLFYWLFIEMMDCFKLDTNRFNLAIFVKHFANLNPTFIDKNYLLTNRIIVFY